MSGAPEIQEATRTPETSQTREASEAKEAPEANTRRTRGTLKGRPLARTKAATALVGSVMEEKKDSNRDGARSDSGGGLLVQDERKAHELGLPEEDVVDEKS